MTRIRSKRREITATEGRMELFATARQVDSAAAQVRMLSEDDCVSEAEADELEELYVALRRVAVDMFERVGHA